LETILPTGDSKHTFEFPQAEFSEASEQQQTTKPTTNTTSIETRPQQE
jgi:hypothetical protein